MTLVLLSLVAAAAAVPHVLRLERSSPGVAAAIWMAAIALRALVTLFAVLSALLFIPTTRAFALVTQWCWHGILPPVSIHLPVSGQVLGAATLVLPLLAVATSALWIAVGVWRAVRRVRVAVDRSIVGPGPLDSIVVADRDVLVAATGLRRPRIVISAGALLALDDAELAASLEHERGHIARFHRYVVVAAECCRAVARFLPGTRAAARELCFQLERDADRYALAARHDPAALASAICKAARTSAVPPPAFALNGGSVRRRVRLLLDSPTPPDRVRDRPLRLVAAVMLALVVTASAGLPATAHAGLDSVNAASLADHCPG